MYINQTTNFLHRFDFIVEHCMLAVAFFLPLSLDIASIFLGIGAATWLARMPFGQPAYSRKALVDIGVLLFAVFAACSIVNSPDKGFSQYNYLEIMSRYLLIYYVLGYTIKSEQQVKHIVGIMIMAAVAVSLYGFYQYASGLDISALDWVDGNSFPQLTVRVFSTLHNPNLLAGYLVVMMSITGGVACCVADGRQRLWLVAVIGILGVCLVMTYSRGAWISLLTVLAAFSVMYNRKLFWLLLLVPLVAGIAHHTVVERVASIFNPTMDSSSALRLALWESSWAMIQDHPLLGIGWGAYWKVYPSYDFFINDPATTIFHAHNMYLQIAAEIGVPGLMAFLAVLIGHLRLAFLVFSATRLPWLRGLMLGAAAALISLTAGGFTDYIMFSTQISMLFWSLCALIIAGWRIHYR